MFLSDQHLHVIQPSKAARAYYMTAVRCWRPDIAERHRDLKVAVLASHMRQNLPAIHFVTHAERNELVVMIDSIPVMRHEAAR